MHMCVQALRRECAEYRVTVASLKGTQHRLTQQLEAVTRQLHVSNDEKQELTQELEEVRLCMTLLL